MNTTSNASDSDDFLHFAEDDTPSSHSAGHVSHEPWEILIVDDDEDVHHATLFALKDVLLCGRPLHFLQAYSATEARQTLEQHPDIAAILLDVVMENDNAGLNLVRIIRDEMLRQNVRIILRTGQPGYAPELEAIQQYDINDYKTKSELTRTRLVTSLTTAVRCYDQLKQLDTHRHGLTKIIEAASDLFARRGMENFAEGVLLQIATLLKVRPEGLICATALPSVSSSDQFMVVGAAGRYRPLINHPLQQIPEPGIVARVSACLQSGQNTLGEEASVLYFKTHSQRGIAVYIETESAISELDQRLLEVFCVNISVGFENVDLFANLNKLAFSDPLTGLHNRTRLIQIMDEKISHNRSQHILALVDIDHFSEINDALGHQNGDRLIQVVADRLKNRLGPNTVLARSSADTFAVFGPDGEVSPERILEEFTSPFGVNEHFLRIKATLGLVRLAETEGNGLSALKDANIALNRAKTGRRGQYQFYSADMLADTRHRLMILHDLRSAIEARGLHVHYQPQIDLQTQSVCGVEALIRWKTRSGEYIPPQQFIPIAEYSGLIVDMGEWVLRTALLQLKQWDANGLPPLRMAVNVSQVQFRSQGFVQMVQRAIKEIDVEPERLELEITESVAMEDSNLVIDTLSKLKAIGVTIAIDDFGTGFSSLSYLQQLPIDRLKIDRAFIKDISEHNSQRASIAEMIIRLGTNLGMTVIAEGVENSEQRDKLIGLGCHEAQGFFYSKALPPDELPDWILQARS